MDKKIWQYFKETIEYPREIAHNPIPYNVLWHYISSTFLDGFINYAEAVSVFVLDKYTTPETSLTDENISYFTEDELLKFKSFEGTKKEFIDAIISGEKKMYHTNLGCFKDEIIVLSEIKTNHYDELTRYIFFWYDNDVSDCMIGRFETTDTKEDVIKSIVNHLNDIKESGIISNYYELPPSVISGWVKFI